MDHKISQAAALEMTQLHPSTLRMMVELGELTVIDEMYDYGELLLVTLNVHILEFYHMMSDSLKQMEDAEMRHVLFDEPAPEIDIAVALLHKLGKTKAEATKLVNLVISADPSLVVAEDIVRQALRMK